MLEPAGIADVIEASEVTDATDARADFDARFALARGRLLRIAASLVGAGWRLVTDRVAPPVPSCHALPVNDHRSASRF